jgi:hypothetical protein
MHTYPKIIPCFSEIQIYLDIPHFMWQSYTGADNLFSFNKLGQTSRASAPKVWVVCLELMQYGVGEVALFLF